LTTNNSKKEIKEEGKSLKLFGKYKLEEKSDEVRGEPV